MPPRSHRLVASIDARIMLLIFACILAAVAAAPSYDQRQDGDLNVQADIQNIVFVFGLPKKLPVENFLNLLMKHSKRSGEVSIAQDRADVHAMEAFVEPSTPYRVVIGSEGERSVDADTGNAIVVVGQRRSDPDPEPYGEIKLIGATEQCGPDRKRDPVTLMCKFDRDIKSEKIPEVIPVPA